MAGGLFRLGAAALKPVAKPLIGAGVGFATEAADRAFDDDESVFESPSSYLAAGGLGALLGGSMGFGRGASKGLAKLKMNPTTARKIGKTAGVLGTAGGGLGLVGNLFDGGGEKLDGGEISGIMNSLGLQSGPVQMPGDMGPGGVDLFKGGMYGGLGAPPEFGKSLSDYMNDPTLNNLANQQIITQNNAIGRVNRDLREEMVRSIQGNAGAGRAAQQQYDQIRRDNVRQSQDIQQNARTNQQRVVNEADRVAEEVGASIISDDHTRHDLQNEQAIHGQDVADRQAADSRLLEQLAKSSQDALATIAGADAQATRENSQAIRTKAMSEIQSNRREAADNWQQKTGILGSLADTAMQRDLQQHQLALQAWGARMDALNAYRKQQLETQQMQSGGGLDASMINALVGLGTSPSGMTYDWVTPEGEPVSYKEQAKDLWSPEQRDYYNQYLAQALGLPQGFTFFNEQPKPQMKEDKFGPWR